MKDIDEDTLLGRHLSGDPPPEAFKEQVLRDSLAALARTRPRRSAWRRAELAAAAVVIAGVGFLCGRPWEPRAPIESADIARQAVREADGVTVPRELVVWLDAARFFRQLGMQERMARAVERAGRLLPAEAFIADGRPLRVFAAAGSTESQTELGPTNILGANPPADTINRILAQSLGD